jgi:glycosyltransferase involved in cell wall biosynthesis
MPESPLVSVIIPVYNCQQYLAAAIDSVLAQTYRAVEVIVVDDASTDDSAAVAQRYPAPVRYVAQPHSGAGAARNHGVRQAQGQFLAFLDADDVWLPDKLTRQMAAFHAHPTLDMVFGYVKQFHSPDVDEQLRTRWGYVEEILRGYLPGTLLIRRDAFCRAGFFATQWQLGEFIDWYVKATESGLQSYMCPEIVMHRRIHATNMGIRKHQHRRDYVRILKAALDRRRLLQG